MTYLPRKPAVLAVLVVLALTVFFTQAASAAKIISANPNKQGPLGATPPMLPVVQLSGIDLVSYHIKGNQAAQLADFNTALGYSNYGKVKMISDDAGFISVDFTKDRISAACNAGVHFEHFDGALGARAMSALPINTKNHFPQTSQQILEHINTLSCVSDLAPNGVLSRNGSTLYWTANGVTKPITLVGHSWTGALTGLNFDINGYLNVLADHRVNLVRPWVIEQWTAYQYNNSVNNQPVGGNASLAFSGDLLSHNVDPLSVSTSFLNRLEQFVDAAAARGIVVQLSLFDRHGLKNNPNNRGEWIWSPYNRDNNIYTSLSPGASGKAPSSFLSTSCFSNITALGVGHTSACYTKALIDGITQRLANKGNVIYELMNEPLALGTTEWTQQQVTDWHAWAANEVSN